MMAGKTTSETRATHHSTGALALCLLVLAGCQAPQSPQAPAAEPTAAATTAPAPTHAVTASPFAVQPQSAGQTAVGVDSYRQLLQRYPPAQQATIAVWYARFANEAMAFTSDAQWRWMRLHDYPTPDDVLRAALMTDAELRELAVHGDTKANFFHLARLLEEFAKADQISATPSRHKQQLRVRLEASMNRALASGSAFAGYMFGNYYAAMHGKNAARLGLACGLMWAEDRNDNRPASHNRQFILHFPGVSAARAAEVYLDMITRASRINPYYYRAYRGRGKLFMPRH